MGRKKPKVDAVTALIRHLKVAPKRTTGQSEASAAMTDRLDRAKELESAVRAEAAARGLSLTVSWMDGGGRRTPHWQIDHDGQRLVDFWPSSGRWRCPGSGHTALAASPWEALGVASLLKSLL